MEKLLTLLNKIFSKVVITNTIVPADKQMHFITGMLGSMLLAFFIGYWAVLFMSLIGVAKEVYDYKHPLIHTCDFFDWLATTLGGILGAGLWQLIFHL